MIEITSKQYIVRVSQQGVMIGEHLVNASNALNAINFVERYYYQPVQWEKTLIENRDGKCHEVALANNWHGYMFEAHITEAVPVSVDNLHPIKGTIYGGVK